MTKVEVALGERSYDILIEHGLVNNAAQYLAPLAREGRLLVVSDENVWAAIGGVLKDSLSGLDLVPLLVPPGEESKSWGGLQSLVDRMLHLGVERTDHIVAFGGGVIGDLAGFASAIVNRGCNFVQIPTTLLAQVDSSVGGKTAIDVAAGKNLVGAFHQPRLVLADLEVLSTLPDREMRAGYAEVIKYGLLGDFGFFEWLEVQGANVLAREPEALSRAVARSVEMKAEIVAEDETEQGRRALLNLGHTFGHALEAELAFSDVLLHGEAVALGCALAFRFAVHERLCTAEDAERVERALTAAKLPVHLADVGGRRFKAQSLVGHMLQDKKAKGGHITLILPRRIGEAFVARDADVRRLEDFLSQEGA